MELDMGRHYDGDISGKFWFGIQSSNDAIHFGAKEIEPEPEYTHTGEEEEYQGDYIDYRISFANIDNTLDGIQECKRELGDELLRFTEFFNAHPNGYNEEMIAKYYKKHFNKTINDEFIRWFLTIYARLGLGIQILVYFNKNPEKDCIFTAEM